VAAEGSALGSTLSPVEGLIELIHHHQRAGAAAGQLQDQLGARRVRWGC